MVVFLQGIPTCTLKKAYRSSTENNGMMLGRWTVLMQLCQARGVKIGWTRRTPWCHRGVLIACFYLAKLFYRDVPQEAVTKEPAGVDAAVISLSGINTDPVGDASCSDAAVTFLSGVQQQSGSKVSEERRRRGGGQSQRSVRLQSLALVQNSFDRTWGLGLSDHACISSCFLVQAGAVAEQLPQAEYLRVVRSGLGTKVARRPAESESCAHKTQSLPFCSKDYEKARMPPGSAVILEDARRKGLYRLYTRRNCHHVNTHDPLKAIGLVCQRR